MAPADRMTSRSARRTWVRPPFTYSTPTALPFSMIIRVTRAPVSTRKLRLLRAGPM
ncbi:hypothetical protein ABIA15_002148 [Sinorhizobium fredii]